MWVRLSICLVALTLGVTCTDYDSEELPPWKNPLMDLPFNKRAGSCNGFPCIMSQLGDTTGRRATYSMIVDVLGRCVRDPHCGPGKRGAVPVDLHADRRFRRYRRSNERTTA